MSLPFDVAYLRLRFGWWVLTHDDVSCITRSFSLIAKLLTNHAGAVVLGSGTEDTNGHSVPTRRSAARKSLS